MRFQRAPKIEKDWTVETFPLRFAENLSHLKTLEQTAEAHMDEPDDVCGEGRTNANSKTYVQYAARGRSSTNDVAGRGADLDIGYNSISRVLAKVSMAPVNLRPKPWHTESVVKLNLLPTNDDDVEDLELKQWLSNYIVDIFDVGIIGKLKESARDTRRR